MTNETTTERGPMEQWAIEHGVSVPVLGRFAMFDGVDLNDLLTFAREQDDERRRLLAAVAVLVELAEAMISGVGYMDVSSDLHHRVREALAKAPAS